MSSTANDASFSDRQSAAPCRRGSFAPPRVAVNDGTYEKHIVPRLAARALLRRVPRGVSELVAALPQAPGAIYPNAIIEAIWFAAKGQLGLDLFGVAGRSPQLSVLPDDETSAAAARALRDLFAESPLDNGLFIRLLDFVHGLWMQADGDGDVVARERALRYGSRAGRLKHLSGDSGRSDVRHSCFVGNFSGQGIQIVHIMPPLLGSPFQVGREIPPFRAHSLYEKSANPFFRILLRDYVVYECVE